MKTGNHKQHVILRAFTGDDLAVLDRFATDAEVTGAFGWAGFADPHLRRRRFAADGLLGEASGALAVVIDDEVAGMVTWEAADRGGPSGGCYEVGAVLLPGHHGHETRAEAHRRLVDYLFQVTRAHRLQAFADAENLAAQQVLETTGFHREGLLCQVTWREGAYRDAVVYGLLRSEAQPQ
ncbi:RimJ/RimL family protein N-acetyltransferase [Amycolatopsis sulphurea]|uniref:RimJ/RimL family protein N-acetyltransferase n=1 Tax=Amycolatopsis sulphurea TaxID=76022 RepID=A0A2A9FAE8_9PSEU|nr:GNAT family protein [Amycolatopsis sulphurea]PFG47522.1 RimJ/RimL family protein N-acetyltransferase [Amycolatopsis sulphurea]